MTKQERKVILIGAGVVILALLIVLVVNGISKKGKEEQEGTMNETVEQNTEKYVTNLEDGTKLNNGEEFNKNKKYKNIEISDIQFTFENGRSVLLATVKNTGSTKQELEIVKLTILGDNNQIIDEIEPLMPDLEPGEEKQFNAIITGADSVNARDFKIEAKR